jgi:hypothetical protein
MEGSVSYQVRFALALTLTLTYVGLLDLEYEGTRIRRKFGDYLTSSHGAATQNT